jgi:hypothetical protein
VKLLKYKRTPMRWQHHVLTTCWTCDVSLFDRWRITFVSTYQNVYLQLWEITNIQGWWGPHLNGESWQANSGKWHWWFFYIDFIRK